MAIARIGIAAVNVGRPAPLAKGVRSAIGKHRVAAGTWLQLSAVNLEGDDQANRRVHGGPEKAVYAYPSEHLTTWRAELAQPVDDEAPFGENLSTVGVTEAEVVVGERWAWGEAVLQVCQPRWPCQKLILHRGSPDVAERMCDTGRSGWYLRVLQEGRVPVDGPVEVLERPDEPTILDCFLARSDLHHDDPARALRVIASPSLSPQWRSSLQAGLRRLAKPPRPQV